MKTSKSGHLALSSPESGIQNPGTSESLQNLNEEESSSNCNLSKVLLYVLCPFYPLQQIICRRHRNTSQVEIIRVCNNSKGQENNGFIHQNQPVDIELSHDLQLTQTSLPNQLKHTTGNNNEILKYRKNEDEKWIKHRVGPCVLKFLLEKDKSITDTLHTKVKETMTCTHNKCAGSFMRPRLRKATFPARCTELALEDARDFLDLYYESIKRFNSIEHSDMWRHISESLEEYGTYTLPYDLLVFGGKTAWRNAPRCIGRIQWSKLHVFDARHVKTSKEMFDALCKHIDFATNNGNLRAGVPDFRVWNPQLVQFAGYEQEDGSVVGDPSNVHFTKICERLGWKGKGGRFDVLPLVLQASGEEAQWFEIPPEKIILVPLRHPNYPWFEKLGLKWYALPAVANMLFDCAGLEYPAAPFNGWYMGTEIGARDMCDSARYNISETVAKHMGLDTSNSASLWKDEVLVQVNIAVLYSFQASNVTIVDHHTASESFMTHMEQEQKLRGGCPADWVWIVPPMSGSITPVFHQEMLNYNIKPLFEYQDHAWKGYKWTDERSGNKKRTFREVVWAVAVARSMMVKAMQARQKCTILFATETRKSARYAKILEDIFNKVFSATVYCMDEYDAEFLAKEKLVVIVTSTFGDGDPPDNGMDFQKHLLNVKRKTDSESYSVFALGSRAYPQFCAFGHEVDSLLHDLGATRVYPLLEGDELSGQDNSFKEWSQNVFKESCRLFSIEIPSDIADGNVSLYELGTEWHEDRYKLSLINQSNSNDLCQDISHVHDRKVRYIKLISRKNLQAP